MYGYTLLSAYEKFSIMLLTKGKTIALVIGSVLLPATVAGAVFVGASRSFQPSKAENSYSAVLNQTNQPTLDSSGNGTASIGKGVIWEYNNAQDYAGGHVSLKNNSYFGVSSTTPYGYTQITNVEINYSAGSDGELWLLKSVDGTTWSEDKLLKASTDITSTSASTTTSNNWRYIRFYYNWGSSNSTLSVGSVSISYGCSGVSAPEDVDSAKKSNVIATSSNLTSTAEYSDLSPNSTDGEAVSFTKEDSASTWINIGFGKTYKVGPVQNAKVEFDMKTSNIKYGKYIQLMKDTGTLGSAIYSDKSSAYKCTNISGDWYHIELPITTVISTISGILVNGEPKDKPHSDVLNKEFNGIKINAGTCVIDNLRLSQSPCELGIFNNPSYNPTVNEFFWLKVAWVGVLYPEQVTMTFSDDTLARHIPITDENLLNGSPFYIELLNKGKVTVTCKVVSGYNRQEHTIQHTIKIN